MTAHTWIFQFPQALTPAQKAQIEAGMAELLANWKAHGTPVPGTSEIRHDQFLLVQAVPGSTSGCSIDSMNRGVLKLLSDAGVQHSGAEYIYYRTPEGSIRSLHFRDMEQAVKEKRILPETQVFDASLGQSGDISRFEMPVSQTWMQRYLA